MLFLLKNTILNVAIVARTVANIVRSVLKKRKEELLSNLIEFKVLLRSSFRLYNYGKNSTLFQSRNITRNS